MKRNISQPIKVKLGVRSVLALLTIALGGVAMGQTTLTDNDCRITLTSAFDALRIVDPNNMSAYSYGLRLDTTEVLNNRTTTYTGWLKLYDDSLPTGQLLKSELTLYVGTNLVQRTVADGIKLWSYDPAQNAYSVNAYNGESGSTAPRYREDFVNFYKQTVIGSPQNLMTLMDQASITGTARVKDWIGGIPFEGQQFVDPNDPLHLTNIIWEKLPDNSRFVQFNTQSYDGGMHWNLDSAQIHRQDKVGASTKVSDTYLTPGKDANNVPLSYTKASADFIFIPPARSKVLATPRTIKF